MQEDMDSVGFESFTTGLVKLQVVRAVLCGERVCERDGEGTTLPDAKISGLGSHGVHEDSSSHVLL